jgi:hypothetical protein
MSSFAGNYGSGSTFLSNLVSRPEFLQYTAESIFEQSKWIQSGIVQRNAALDARAGGTRVRVPFFDPIAPTETQILSTNTWGGGGGYLVPQNVTADEQIMTLLHRGFAYAADDLSKLGSGADPLAHVRDQLTAAINKLKTGTLAAQLLGLFGGISGAGVLGPNQTDKSFAGVPGSVTEANYLNVANVVAAKATLGERGDEMDSIAMHSNVAYYLQQVGMLTFSTSALAASGAIVWGGGGVGVQQTEVPFFAGLRVVIDDQLTYLTGGTATHAVKYPVYLFKSGVVSEGVQQDLRLAADRNILSMQDVLAVDYHYGYHITGTKWAAAGDNPTNASSSGNLAATGSWNLVFSTTKMVPVARLLVNTPFDTTAYS